MPWSSSVSTLAGDAGPVTGGGGLRVSKMGKWQVSWVSFSGNVHGTLGWKGQWNYTMHSGTLGTCPRWSLPPWDSGMGGTVGLHLAQWDTWHMSGMVPLVLGLWDGRDSGITPCTVRHLVHVWDGPFHPGTLGWEGQWDYTMHSGTLGTCLG